MNRDEIVSEGTSRSVGPEKNARIILAVVIVVLLALVAPKDLRAPSDLMPKMSILAGEDNRLCLGVGLEGRFVGHGWRPAQLGQMLSDGSLFWFGFGSEPMPVAERKGQLSLSQIHRANALATTLLLEPGSRSYNGGRVYRLKLEASDGQITEISVGYNHTLGECPAELLELESILFAKIPEYEFSRPPPKTAGLSLHD
jgi:hypothetical protein